MFSTQKHIKTSELSCLNICFINLLPLLTAERPEHEEVIGEKPNLPIKTKEGLLM